MTPILAKHIVSSLPSTNMAQHQYNNNVSYDLMTQKREQEKKMLVHFLTFCTNNDDKIIYLFIYLFEKNTVNVLV